MISNINYCCVCSVELLITKKKFEISKKYRLFITIMSKLEKISNYVLTSIQVLTNFSYITIEKFTKRDLETLNGIILNLILMNTFVNFFGMTINLSESLEN